MLTEHGNVTVDRSWIVNETIPPVFARVYYVYSGSVSCFCGGRELALRPGLLYLFPTALPYQLTQDPDHPLVCTFLHLDICPLLVPDVIELDPEREPVLKALLSAFSVAAETEKLPVREAVSDALEAYFLQHGCVTQASNELTAAMLLIARCKDRIPAVEEMSRSCGYHPQYFIRKFRREIGVTPHQYLLHLHLREAASLLRRGSSVSAAAADSGFADQKNFEKAFRKNTASALPNTAGTAALIWRRETKPLKKISQPGFLPPA